MVKSHKHRYVRDSDAGCLIMHASMRVWDDSTVPNGYLRTPEGATRTSEYTALSTAW